MCSAPDLAGCLMEPLALLSARLSESCLVSLVRGTSRPSKGSAPIRARCTVAANGEARSNCSRSSLSAPADSDACTYAQ